MVFAHTGIARNVRLRVRGNFAGAFVEAFADAFAEAAAETFSDVSFCVYLLFGSFARALVFRLLFLFRTVLLGRLLPLTECTHARSRIRPPRYL